MNRRAFITGMTGGLLATPLATEGQQPGKKVRIGVLSQGFSDPPPGLPLVQPLRALGWVEGHDLVLVSRFDEGRPDRLPTLAAELVDRNDRTEFRAAMNRLLTNQGQDAEASFVYAPNHGKTAMGACTTRSPMPWHEK